MIEGRALEEAEMRKSGVVVLVVMGGVALTACAKKKKDARLPQLFCQAQFAYVQTFEGELGPEVAREYPQDYDAANALQERLQDWKRYTLTMNRGEADLVFVVRTGRVAGGLTNSPYPMQVPSVPGASAQARVPIGGGPGSMPGGGDQNGPYPGAPGGGGPGSGGPGASGPGQPDVNGMPPMGTGGMGAEAGPPNDWLAVYMKPGDQAQQAPIWEHSEKDGLQGPMPLFQKIKDAVESQCSAGRTGGPPSAF